MRSGLSHSDLDHAIEGDFQRRRNVDSFTNTPWLNSPLRNTNHLKQLISPNIEISFREDQGILGSQIMHNSIFHLLMNVIGRKHPKILKQMVVLLCRTMYHHINPYWSTTWRLSTIRFLTISSLEINYIRIVIKDVKDIDTNVTKQLNRFWRSYCQNWVAFRGN